MAIKQLEFFGFFKIMHFSILKKLSVKTNQQKTIRVNFGVREMFDKGNPSVQAGVSLPAVSESRYHPVPQAGALM